MEFDPHPELILIIWIVAPFVNNVQTLIGGNEWIQTSGVRGIDFAKAKTLIPVELWITQQTDDDRRSELSMNVRDEFVAHRDIFDVRAERLELCYVE
jgi:hypothetical protein